jgi:transposase
MRDIDLFQLALGLQEPWFVRNINFDEKAQRIDIHLDFKAGGQFPCPECGKPVGAYDTTDKEWRHMNFFQHEAYLHARVPRVKCPDHGVKQVEVPWGRTASGFTLLFEAFVMALVKEMPVAAIARLLKVTDHRLWRVIMHYVEKALSEQDLAKLEKLGIDETASKRGHNYVTLFVDLDKSNVVYVAEGKDSDTIEQFSGHLSDHKGNPSHITDVSCDMSPAFIKGVEDNLPNAEITFDRFHVMKLVNKAVDEVRKQEQRECPDLKHTRYIWLKNPENLTVSQVERLNDIDIEKSNLKTVRAYQMKIAFQNIFKQTEQNAVQSLRSWYFWATHCRLGPMTEVAHMVKRHWDGILRWFTSRINNGILEGLNSIIQAVKAKARGYRTFRYFRTMIYLVAGNLNYSLPT